MLPLDPRHVIVDLIGGQILVVVVVSVPASVVEHIARWISVISRIDGGPTGHAEWVRESKFGGPVGAVAQSSVVGGGPKARELEFVEERGRKKVIPANVRGFDCDVLFSGTSAVRAAWVRVAVLASVLRIETG